MKRYSKTMIACVAMVVLLGGCNRQIIDLNYNFKYAEIHMPSGEIISGDVESWKDFEDGDQIQVTIDGKTYLTHSSNVVLVSK